jgi:hypothetical protein
MTMKRWLAIATAVCALGFSSLSSAVTCIIYVVDFGDGSPPFYYTDPSDPNCGPLNS